MFISTLRSCSYSFYGNDILWNFFFLYSSYILLIAPSINFGLIQHLLVFLFRRCFINNLIPLAPLFSMNLKVWIVYNSIAFQQGSGVRRKKFRGVHGYDRPHKESGTESPGRRRIFEKLGKFLLRKLQKLHYFGLFFKNFKTQR